MPTTWEPVPVKPKPVEPPKTDAVTAPLPCPPCPPMPPKDIHEARAQGVAEAGTVVLAPLAPKEGPIPGKSGDFVAGVLKTFWESPTIQKLRNAIGLSIFIALGVIAAQIIEAKGNWEVINWHTTFDAAGAAGLLSLAFGYAAWLKVRDNDPVK